MIFFSLPLETTTGEPVKHIGGDVIEYKGARICINHFTGKPYGPSPYPTLTIQNKDTGIPEGQEEYFKKLEAALDSYTFEETVERLKQYDQLCEVATGKLKHNYNGMCPDAVEGYDKRDTDCPVCQLLPVPK